MGYSMSWARQIIEKFAVQESFAYDFLRDDLGYRDTDLAFLLATGDPLWPELRYTAHMWASWNGYGRPRLRRGHYAENTPQMLSTFYAYRAKFVSKALGVYLTAKKNELDSKSSESEGGMGIRSSNVRPGFLYNFREVERCSPNPS